jgi:hypothetical protein
LAATGFGLPHLPVAGSSFNLVRQGDLLDFEMFTCEAGMHI